MLEGPVLAATSASSRTMERNQGRCSSIVTGTENGASIHLSLRDRLCGSQSLLLIAKLEAQERACSSFAPFARAYCGARCSALAYFCAIRAGIQRFS